MNLSIPGLEDVVEVGRGGFATVYRAYQPAFRRTVAVKVLNSADADEATQERFRRECQAMGLLSEHPSIVTVLDAGFLDTGQAYLVMPFMPAGSLSDKVRADGPLTWAEASRVAVKVAGALHAAHDAGVIHRDLKPANILVSEYGEPKLADFGIARVAGGHETQSGVVTASLAYAAPEIINGGPPTVASDVYGLGATIYALLTGRPPFEAGPDLSMGALLQQILTTEAPELRGKGVPAPFADVVERAMAKDPDERQDSAAQFGREVRLAQDELGIRPTELTIVKVAPESGTAASADAEPVEGSGDDEADLAETAAGTVGGIASASAARDPLPVDDVDDPFGTQDIPAAEGDESTAATSSAPPSVEDDLASDAGAGGRRGWVLGAAAAVVIAIVVVIVALAAGGGGDDDGDTASASPDTETRDDPADDASGDAEAPAEEPTDEPEPEPTSPPDPSAEGAGAGSGEAPQPPTGSGIPTLETLPTLDDLCPDGLDPTVPEPGVDLGNAELSCFDWSGADLSEINFFESHLVGVDMTGADLRRARFDTTRLTGVRLAGADLTGAIISWTLEDMNMLDIDLSRSRPGDGQWFVRVYAAGYDFTELPGGLSIVFTESNLAGANLAGLGTQGIDQSLVTGANLDDMTLYDPGDDGTIFSGFGSVFDDTSFRNAPLAFADLADASLAGADLTGADLSGANLHRVDLTGAILDGADLTDIDWSDTTCPDGSNSNDNLGRCEP